MSKQLQAVIMSVCLIINYLKKAAGAVIVVSDEVKDEVKTDIFYAFFSKSKVI